MSERAIPAYPDRYTPGTLRFDMDIRFEARDGQAFRPPEAGLVAGTCGTWILEIANRERDLPAGARLTLVRMNCQIAFKPQTDRPGAGDYCAIETNSDASLRLLGGRSAVNLLTVALDFACPGAMSMDPDRRTAVWSAYMDACAQMDGPGRHVPLLSYEAHTRDGGGRQVIFHDYQNEPIPLDMRDPIAKVDSTYGARDDVLLEVHIGGQLLRWHVYRPGRERFPEVCSGFGCAEWRLQKALQLGYRPAVCGVSDLHLGLMGGPRAVETFRGRFGYAYPMRQRDSGYGTGPLTAVRAERLTKNDLWQAIQARHTYAISGARIYLDVTCNSHPSGSEIALGDVLSIAINCHGCAPPDRVDLIVGPHCQQSWHPDEADAAHPADVVHPMDFPATQELSAAEIPGYWLYVRAHQVDGEYAWSSPFWLTRVSASASADLPAWNADDPIDHRTIESNQAARYLPDLMQYLETEEQADRFRDLTPVDVIEQSTDVCALFHCYWGDEGLPMSIRWFYEFEIPKVRYDFGWRDYGAYDEVDLVPNWRPSTGIRPLVPARQYQRFHRRRSLHNAATYSHCRL